MPESAQFRDKFKHNLAAEVLRSTGFLRLSAVSYSMLPSLWPGDPLTIRAHSLDQIQTGDVVLFLREGRFFIHRTVRAFELGSERRVVTRGDAMPKADTPISAAELLGKVVSVQRDASHIFQVPACSFVRRCIGLSLAYSVRLRSLALWWHARRSNVPVHPEWSPEQA
jgi:signal peptidase I